MVPKLHKKGLSFSGLSAYLLHDPDHAKTSDRVSWSATRNLVTQNANAATRAMAATAMEAEALKKEAGVKATGRKSKNVVLHLTLAWAPEEAEKLTKEEMLRAADGALKALGAEGHQALIVCHTDKKQPHIHLAINRVNPDDGRLLSSTREKLKLSRFAQEYEEDRLERGVSNVICEERVLNNAARDRGQYTRGKKDIPRQIFEQQQGLDQSVSGARLREKEQKKDRTLRKKEVQAIHKWDQDWAALQAKFSDDLRALKRDEKRQVTIAEQTVGEQFKPDWGRLRLDQEEERQEFAKREQSLTGKGRNLLSGIRNLNWGDLLRSDRRSKELSVGFGLLAGRQSARSETFRRYQARQNIDLEKREKEAKRVAAEAERQRQQQKQAALLQAYLAKREFMIAKREADKEKFAGLWAKRRKERDRAWEKERKKIASRVFEQQATPEKERHEAAVKHMDFMKKLRADRERGKQLTLSERIQARKDKDRDRGRGDHGR